ncbi:hypothetical protein COW86_03125, partial [Candidatus Kuenenbacteria bacterium CG22_combo_CG10-13_8_21_14_all_39_9]
MLMKKIFLISIIFILSMSLVLPVLAQTTQQPSPSADTAEGIINKQLNDLEAIGLPAEPANPVDPIINLVKMCLSVLAVV